MIKKSFRKKTFITKVMVTGVFVFLIMVMVNAPLNAQILDPTTQTEQLTGGRTFTGNSSGNRNLPGSPYGYEIWSSTNNRNTKLIWYGPDQGGGGAFRSEWNNSGNFLGRVGYFWNEGKPYTAYGNLYCGFNFTKGGSDGGFSYLGIYGWSRNPLIEYYIVEDWFSRGQLVPYGGSYKGEFTVDGSVYKIYVATRTRQPSIDGTATFQQYFSVRQDKRQAGTVSITEHFKKWEELGMRLGTNMYEAKFKVEVGGGNGWFDMTWLQFYNSDNGYGY